MLQRHANSRAKWMFVTAYKAYIYCTIKNKKNIYTIVKEMRY